ncbi:MAG: chorismate mutase [Oscillospiraceae bacterium]|nr:chorismate mutase [Oscillospiraceae bacterium]
MGMDELRSKIDEIDDGLIRLFERRMDLSAEIAAYKRRNGIPVHDPARERGILEALTAKVGKGRGPYVAELYALIFRLSRAEQERTIDAEVGG